MQPLTSYVPSPHPIPSHECPSKPIVQYTIRNMVRGLKAEFLQAQLSQDCISRPFILCLLAQVAQVKDGAGSAPLWLMAGSLLPCAHPAWHRDTAGLCDPQGEGWSALSCRKARALTPESSPWHSPCPDCVLGHSRPGWLDLISFSSHLHPSTSSFLTISLEGEVCWS